MLPDAGRSCTLELQGDVPTGSARAKAGGKQVKSSTMQMELVALVAVMPLFAMGPLLVTVRAMSGASRRRLADYAGLAQRSVRDFP